MKQSQSIDSKDLAAWFRTPLGAEVLRRERLVTAQLSERFFGFHQVEFGIAPDLAVSDDTLLGHRVQVLSEPVADPQRSILLSLPEEIGIESDSVDLVVLHHTLDIASDPHQALREAARILRAHGHVVVIGFNPLSLWGLARFFNRSRHVPWSLRFLSPLRVDDWLALLQLPWQQRRVCMAEPPFRGMRWLQRMQFLDRVCQRLKLPLGCFYVITAQKQVAAGLRQGKVRWQRQPLAGLAAVHTFTPVKQDESKPVSGN